MGGKPASRRAKLAQRGAAAMIAVLAVTACGSDDATETGEVGSADAIAAVVAWQAAEQEPVLSDSGEPQLPVIFVVPDDGATIAVGVQADVTEATVDWATVRFADDVADTFDSDIEGEPVRDDGSLLLLGPIPEPAPTIELDVVRYTAVDAAEPLTFQISSTPPNDSTADSTPAPSAEVIAVTRP